MKIKLILILLLCPSLVQAQNCFSNFRMRDAMQQTPMWCWAATLQSIIDFHHRNSSVTQCDIVKDYFGVEDCADASVSGGYLNKMKSFLENNDLGYTFSCDFDYGPLSVQTIANNIVACKPIIIQIKISPFDNSSHAVVIMGIWSQVDAYGRPYTQVVLRDPYPYNWNSFITKGLTGIGYNRLCSIWVSSLYNIEPN